MATIEQPAVIKQTRAPGTPPDTKTMQFKDSRPDVSRWEKAAQKAYKDSMTNWEYYVKNEWKKQSEEAVANFGDSPAQLQVALEKIRTGMLPSDVPEGIKQQFMEDTYYDSASIMNKALAKRKKAEKEDTTINANEYANGLKNNLATDFFNVLSYNESENAEKRPFDVEIYNKNKADLAELADLTNDNGQYWFTEDSRKEMKRPTSAIIEGFNNYISQKSLPELEQWEQDKFNNKDAFMADTGIDDEIYNTMRKSVDLYKNIKKRELNRAHNEERIKNSLGFLDNPIVYRANLSRIEKDPELSIPADNEEINKQLDAKAEEIYSLADKVKDGKIPPEIMRLAVMKVASITVDNDNPSIVDNNLLKAFDANLAFYKAGANEDQLATLNKNIQIAMTDTSFKQSVAALASKPSFDSMLFENKRARNSLFYTLKDDDTRYVERIGRDAYMNTMSAMAEIYSNPDLTDAEKQQKTAQALAYYDTQVQKAYDYIKRDIIDPEYIKNALEKQGYAMIQLNGNMSKIVGRLPNGEYIIEQTGEKINGGI